MQAGAICAAVFACASPSYGVVRRQANMKKIGVADCIMYSATIHALGFGRRTEKKDENQFGSVTCDVTRALISPTVASIFSFHLFNAYRKTPVHATAPASLYSLCHLNHETEC